ncbi:MAG: NADPH:quinone reductase [Pseudomonadota bacterium]
MKAIWFEKTGDARDVLEYGERSTPTPRAGEVLVRLSATAVNPSDVKKRAGAQDPGFEDGYVIPHSDGAGVIEAVGDGVDSARIGERVWVYQAQFQRHLGTAAQYVAVDSFHAPLLPDNIDFPVGACMGIPAMTAHRAVFADGEVEGQTLLVTGAAGRVGYYAAQWAKMAGARLVVTAGTDANLASIDHLSPDLAINYRNQSVADSVLDFTDGKGVDRIIDVEFGKNVDDSVAMLKTNGSVATYSSSQDPNPKIPFYPLMFKNILLRNVLVYNMPAEAKQLAIEDIYDGLATDTLVHRIGLTVSLSDTVQAHEAVEAGGLNGCAVMTIE